MSIIVLIVLALLFLGALPIYPYSRGWGYYPSGIVLTIAVTVAVMALRN